MRVTTKSTTEEDEEDLKEAMSRSKEIKPYTEDEGSSALFSKSGTGPLLLTAKSSGAWLR